ncbi:YrbL family protein [Psychrobacter jeotgali]|uniref:YrbL family protein n=1 Tax=Psychrobacter jeotgali TaxID=179010 RepID=UPI00191A82CE|nr:YrbL family protein [Psychrobacter jeotgali]
MILVKNLNLLGEGTQKKVYEHPEDANKVIKIMKPEHATATGGRVGQHHLRAHRSQGIYKQFRRELLQYLQLCKNNYGKFDFTFPIETVYGFAPTDEGLGLVTEKVLDPNGSITSLYELATQNIFDDKHAQALDSFFDACAEQHVVFGEVNIAGIMYTEQRQGFPEFVLVDGIGEKLLIPFRAMSKSINTRNIRKIESYIKSQINYY